MTKTRIAIPEDIAATIQFRSDRTCCVCRKRGNPTQLHHLDENPSNNDADNLAVLCLHCHEETQIKGGFGRKLNIHQVKIYREDWYARVKTHREAPDTANRSESNDHHTLNPVIQQSLEKRPWISLACRLASGFRKGNTHWDVEGHYISLAGIATNHGHTLATNLIFRAEIGLISSGNSDEALMNTFCDKWKNVPEQTAETIFPNCGLEVGHELFLPQADIDAALSAGNPKFRMIAPVVYGCVNYKAAHIEGLRQTRFAHRLCRVGNQRQPMAILQDGPNWLKIDVALMAPALGAAD